MRKTDMIGVSGGLMLAVGAFLFLRDGASVLPLWATWLIGPLLWYGGFVVIVLWFLTRIFRASNASQDATAAKPAAEHRRCVSNFLEHDSEPAPEAAKSHTLAYTASFLAIALSVPALSGTASAEDAAGLFKTKCAPCHGANADAKTPMATKMNIRDLRVPEIQKQSDAEIKATIANGKSKMPAYGGKLTVEQIGELTAYIRSLAKK